MGSRGNAQPPATPFTAFSIWGLFLYNVGMRKAFKTILRLLIVLAVIAGIAVGAYFILKACGFSTLDDFERLRAQMGDSLGFWAIIVLLQIIQAVFIQCSNSLITAPISILFCDELWKVFLASWLGVFIGNVILYFIGRFCGGKLLKFVLGDEEEAEKLKGFMRTGKWFYLIGCVCPIIPSDVLNILAGSAKYDPRFVIISTFITRGICVATTTWLVGLIPNYPWVAIILGALIIGMILLAFFATRRAIKLSKQVENAD